MIKSLLSVVLLSATLLCIGCKDKDDDNPVNCNNWASEIADEAQAVTDAGVAWGSDPSNTQKCNAYRDALQDYVDVLEASENCATQAGQHDDWQEIIESAQLAVNNLQC